MKLSTMLGSAENIYVGIRLVFKMSVCLSVCLHPSQAFEMKMANTFKDTSVYHVLISGMRRETFVDETTYYYLILLLDYI